MILDLAHLVERVAPILVFLVAITLVAEICDLSGLFDVLAHRAARAAQGPGRRAVAARRRRSRWRAPSLLSLDTTAVLLTPVAIAVARQVGAPPLPFAMTTLWLANTASLLLPVSNLTNLLALHPFAALGVGTLGYIKLMALPAVVAILVTVAVLWLLHRRDLRGTYDTPPRGRAARPSCSCRSRPGCAPCSPRRSSSACSPRWRPCRPPASSLAATYWRAPELLRRIRMPWLTVLGICVLFLVIDAALRAGLEAWLQHRRRARHRRGRPLPRQRPRRADLQRHQQPAGLPRARADRGRLRRPARGPAHRRQRRAHRHDVGLGRDAAVGLALPLGGPDRRRRPHRADGRPVRGRRSWPPRPWPSPPT